MGARHALPSDLPSALDFDREWRRAAEEDGRSQRISRNVARTLYAPPHGSGTTDTVRLGNDALANVINCVVPRAARWTYADEEALITLRASLACNVEFRYGAAPLAVEIERRRQVGRQFVAGTHAVNCPKFSLPKPNPPAGRAA